MQSLRLFYLSVKEGGFRVKNKTGWGSASKESRVSGVWEEFGSKWKNEEGVGNKLKVYAG